MNIERSDKWIKQAEIVSCSFDLDIKAFKGKGAFRSLMRAHQQVVESIHDEMQALANEVSEVEAPITLVCTSNKKARGTTGIRLRWRIRGKAAYDGFRVIESLFGSLPVAFHAYLRAVNQRARELNALEAVTRYAAAQLESYLEHGTVKIVGNVCKLLNTKPMQQSFSGSTKCT